MTKAEDLGTILFPWLSPEYGQEMRDTMKKLEKHGYLQWHCHKHGYITAEHFAMFGKEDQATIFKAIEYFFGSKAIFWNKKRGIEFADNTSVYPQWKKIWQWCGETVLFNDWKEREEENREAASAFVFGDDVSFEHNGYQKYGKVIGINKRITVMVGKEKWYIPATQLRKEG